MDIPCRWRHLSVTISGTRQDTIGKLTVFDVHNVRLQSLRVEVRLVYDTPQAPKESLLV